MLKRLQFLALYFVFWIGCFEGGRILFLLYQWSNTVRLDASLILGILEHGLRMDVSLVCAVMIPPVCIVARAGYLPGKTARRMLAVYTTTILAVWALATVADLEIFSVWGYRLDASPLHYLTSTREAFASAAGSPLLLLAVLLALLITLGIVTLWSLLLPQFVEARTGQLKSVLLVAVLTPALTVGTRGGLDWRVPISAGSVYFSRDNFANQAALNPVWNFFASIITGSGEGAVERYTDPTVAQEIVDSLVTSSSDREQVPHLLARRPSRILILFWEGFTAKIVEPLNGVSGITPGFTRLAKEGILFDHFYASGTRTTNGLVAGLTGFPTHPRTNPLASRQLGAMLPRLSRFIAANGYRTGFYYGAPLSFENRNRFLLRGRYDEIVEKEDFPQDEWGSPWGVHDPIMLARLYRALDTAPGPLFAATLTLSSHEPYEVPGPRFVEGDDPEHNFLNSQAYTDRAVAEFIDRAKRAPWWDSTLIIILGDHGHPLPRTASPLASAPSQFHIPMLWIGGALSQHGVVNHRVGSQSDLPKVLLDQLGIESSSFTFSKDFLAPDANQFAFYAFRDGFGYVDSSGSYVFDNVAHAVIDRTGSPSPSSLRAGRAFQQVVTEAYRDLSAPTRR